MAPIATADLEDYYPAPFPSSLPTITLKTVSTKDLLNGGKDASHQIYEALSTDGFFHLDLTTDPQGQAFLDAANKLHHVAKDVFNNVSVTEKETWKATNDQDFLDRSYRAMGKDEKGQPRVAEVLMVPANDLLHDPTFSLPTWLEKYDTQYREFAKRGDVIGQAVVQILEQELALAPGTLTDMHRISNETGGFIRIFRYPAPESYDGTAPPQCVGPAHTDGNSMVLLFNWQGGLQITAPEKRHSKVQMVEPDNVKDEWLWVKPIPGHVLINLGDPMFKLTNGVLKNGRHRVVTPPNEQAKFHRYSVLMGLRPRRDTPMTPLSSAKIPQLTAEQLAEPVPTAQEWAVAKVRGLYRQADASKQ